MKSNVCSSAIAVVSHHDQRRAPAYRCQHPCGKPEADACAGATSVDTVWGENMKIKIHGLITARDLVPELSDKPFFVHVLVKARTAILLSVICNWLKPAPAAGLRGAG